uniref:TNFR-Cys domain-containing protein n=1 Tax=Ditylenchus dipsaci TaxID=166011 RepID=A0A915EAW0_9BILA
MGLSPTATAACTSSQITLLADQGRHQTIVKQSRKKKNSTLDHCSRRQLSISSFRCSSYLLLTSALLLLLNTSVFLNAHAFFLVQESTQRDCIDIVCKEDAFGSIKNILVAEDGQTPKECRACQQCTTNGFSVCAKPKSYISYTRRFSHDNRACECAHYIPKNCKLFGKGMPRVVEPNYKLYDLCYLSVIRKPPPPMATNELGDVFVTIEPFWLTDYWKSLKPKNLTLIYRFPVAKPEHCGEPATITNKSFDDLTSDFESTDQSAELAKPLEPEFICNSSFSISMYSEEENSNKKSAKSAHEDDNDYNENDVYDYENEELPPEVQFERDVFAGAKQSIFYYQIKLQRPNQLKFTAGAPASFEDINTIITSESITFDLKPEVYGVGAAGSKEANFSAQSFIIDRKSVENLNLVKPATTTTPRVTTKGRQRPTPITPKSANQWHTTTTTTEAPEQVGAGHHRIAKVDIIKHDQGDLPIHTNLETTTTAIVTSTNINAVADASGDLLPSSNIESTLNNMANLPESTTPSPSTKPSTSPPNYGLEKHLNSGGQYKMVRNVFVATLLLCALLVLCISAYRQGWLAHIFGNAASTSPDTKNVNGKEYQAANSNGDSNHKKS